jgi:hypothetical protein
LNSETKGAKITVDINADLIIPNDPMPIALVTPRIFTYDEVYNFIKLINKENQCMYDTIIAGNILTKNKIEELIDVYINKLSLCDKNMEKEKKEYKKIINELYKKIEIAPSSFMEYNKNPKKYIIGKSYDTQESNISANKIVEVIISSTNYSTQDYNLVVGEGVYSPNIVIKATNNYNSQMLKFKKANKVKNSIISSSIEYDIMKNFKVTEKKAINESNKIVKKISNDLTLTDIAPLKIEYFSKEGVTTDPYGYKLIYTRKFNDVSLSYAEMDNKWNTAPQDKRYSKSYEQEYLIVVYNSNGISQISYSSPMKIKEIKTANAILLPFDKIQEIFNKYILINGFPENQEAYVRISNIKLGMMRIKIPNNNNEYMVVPVWDFYGGAIRSSQSNHLSNQDIENLNQFYGRSFLTINAIDGSIIDRSLGY